MSFDVTRDQDAYGQLHGARLLRWPVDGALAQETIDHDPRAIAAALLLTTFSGCMGHNAHAEGASST
jgi:hypothetical protein